MTAGFITNPGFAIDSLKIRIPIDRVKILNPSLHGNWIAYNTDTGEIDPDVFRNQAFTVRTEPNPDDPEGEPIRTGITTRYAIEKPRGRMKDSHEFVTIGLNSKMLKARYAEGIHHGTIEDLHHAIVDQGQIHVSLPDLLDGHCTDVDFKKDAKVYRPVADQLFTTLEKRTNVSRSMNRGCRTFRQKTNHGIQWNDRKTDSIKEAPFVKIYSKTLDLRHNSTEFTNHHLRGIDYSDVYRVEFTLKNRKAFSHHGIPDGRLSTLMHLDQMKLESIRSAVVLANVESPRKGIKVEGMKSRNQERLSVIATLLDHGLNESEILHAFTRYVENDQRRRDIRKAVVDLYATAIELQASEVPKVKRDQAVQMMRDVEETMDVLLGI